MGVDLLLLILSFLLSWRVVTVTTIFLVHGKNDICGQNDYCHSIDIEGSTIVTLLLFRLPGSAVAQW